MARLEQRGTTWVVVDDAGCRPATPVEIDLWREIDAAREWARWLRRNGSWPVVGRVLYRLTEFDALDWAAAEE